jgi:hypothetical protein
MYLDKKEFAAHPEYFAQNAEGQRKPSDWACTTNAGVRHHFAQQMIARIKEGTLHPTLSPPDGRGFCRCATCAAEDDPKSLEPSNNTVAMTNRYVNFFDAIAREVAPACPDSIISFYCYSDYTQAPTNGITLSPNLCAWIAPIRYCRFHGIGNPICPSRQQFKEVLEGWDRAASRIAYRTYNYNLAECIMPYSMISVWRHDVPFLVEKGCIAFNFETLPSWNINGPHIYLSIRMAYDPALDTKALLDDYFRHLYGPAAPHLAAYWQALDDAYVKTNCHTGSVYGMHNILTPELRKTLWGHLEQARQAAGNDPAIQARIAYDADGLLNADQFFAIRDAINRADLATAKTTYDTLLARCDKQVKERIANHYMSGYLKRFVGGYLEAALAASATPRQVVANLPDQWRLGLDPDDQGVAKQYAAPTFDDSAWQTVATYSNTLDGQGLPEPKTFIWYRTRFTAPATDQPLALFFYEVDGGTDVYVNGQLLHQGQKARRPFTVELGQAVKAGENTIALRVDHRVITELNLGGLIRPILLLQGPAPAPPAAAPAK